MFLKPSMRDESAISAHGPADDADLSAWQGAYRAEQDRLLQQRLPITTAIYLVMVGTAIAVEWVLFPERRFVALLFYAGHLAVSVAGLTIIALRVPRLPIATAGVGLACAWSALLTSYTLFVGHNPERLGSAHICLLYGLFFLLPWRWGHQLAVSIMTLIGAAVAWVTTANVEQFTYGIIVALTGTITSVGGVVYLDRYRFDVFVRQAQLARASREKEEEAEITASLLQVSETLSAHVNEPDLLVRLTRVAVETVGCDWGTTFALDEQRGTYRLAGLFGEPPGVREEIEAVEFDANNLPLVRVLAPGRLIELADAREQDLVPPALLERWKVASELIAPISMGGRVVGALNLAHCERRGPFSFRERRLAQGIVHATALALANSTLIQNLRAANKLRSEFVSTMSHELRTPLNAILGFAQIAQDADLEQRERRGMLERIESAGRELLRLIEDTLVMGRLEAGRDRVELETVQLPLLWEELQRECMALPRKPSVALEWGELHATTTVVTDPRKLTIMIRNLVHNALKFTESGWVRAEMAVERSTLVLRVRDTGIGIGPRDQQVVFEMFRQADGSDTRRYGGTGLGLHIVRRFAEQLGGSVSLDSTPNVGSCFTVTLPLQRAEAFVSPAA